MDKIQQRAKFSNYLVVPTKFGFRKLVRVMSLVLKFDGKCRKKVPTLVDIAETAEMKESSDSQLFTLDIQKNLTAILGMVTHKLRVSMFTKLLYIFTGTQEVIKFNSASKVDKLAIFKNGILFSKFCSNWRIRYSRLGIAWDKSSHSSHRQILPPGILRSQLYSLGKSQIQRYGNL